MIIMMKECVVCNKEFEAYRSNSITCSEECRKAKRAEYSKQWKKENAETLAIKRSEYQKKHREKINKRKLEWWHSKKTPKIDIQCKECKEYYTPISRHKHHTFCSNLCKVRWWAKEPKTNLCTRIRNGIHDALKKRGIRKSEKTFTLLGYSADDLKTHLETQFADGMSWDNMSEWHIDHIRPIASFNYDSTEHPDFKKCWALNNLQPLWAADNLSKNNSWDGIINA